MKKCVQCDIQYEQNVLLKYNFQRDLSDLLYYLQTGKNSISYYLPSITERLGNLEVLPPMRCQMDLISIEANVWIRLFGEIERYSDYEYLILDLSDAVQGLFDILRLCNVIYTLSREDGFAMAKISQYEEILIKCSYEDIWKKTKHCTIPEIKNLPAGLLQLTFTELAEYVQERIMEDLE